MSISLKKQSHNLDRKNFIGGSDARIIMGSDEKGGARNVVRRSLPISRAS
jgi:predicted phage-related endonuclease